MKLDELEAHTAKIGFIEPVERESVVAVVAGSGGVVAVVVAVVAAIAVASVWGN